MAEKFSSKPHIFNGVNFDYWKKKIESYITSQGYDIWLKVASVYEIPNRIETIAQKADFENNCKARNIILNAISRSDFDRVSHLATANEIWKAFNDFHTGSSNIKELRKDVFKKEYIKFEMNSGESLDDYLGRFNKILSDLGSVDASYNVNYSQSKVACYFMNGLDMKIWDVKVTLDILYTKLKTYEMNILSKRTDSKSTALVSSSGSSIDSTPMSIFSAFNALFEDQLEGVSEEDLVLIANRASKALSNTRSRRRGGPQRCFECGQLGHIRSQCPKLRRGTKAVDQDEVKNAKNTKDDKQSKKQFKNMKMKKFYQKAIDEAYAAIQESSDVDFDSDGDDDKGKNIVGVCLMARSIDEDSGDDNEVIPPSSVEYYQDIIARLGFKISKFEKRLVHMKLPLNLLRLKIVV